MQNLYIPQGIKEDAEIFDGFGKKELASTIIVTIIGVISGVILYFISGSLVVCMSTILISAAIAIGIFTKVDNISMFTRICGIIAYAKSQKYYPFTYLSEWGGSDYDSNYQ